MKKKIFIPIIALALVCCCVIGGTIAWLTDKTDAVTNTFTVGNISIELTESTGTAYKIVPGCDIAKDPKVTVEADSENCYLFVKVDEANWPAFTETDGTTRKVNYALAEGWTLVEGQTNVYYRAVTNITADQEFQVLANDKVTVSENLTKEELNQIETAPTLTFTAYAVQLYKGNDQSGNVKFTPEEAWSKIQPQP